MDQEMRDWQAKRDLEVIGEADRIRADSARMAAIKAEVERQQRIVNQDASVDGGRGHKMIIEKDGMRIPQFNRKDQ